MRRAVEGDVDIYYNWVNEALVRENSFNQEDVKYEDHVNWFQKRLIDRESFLYLFITLNGAPAGQVRIEKKVGTDALIDISIDKEFRGASLATTMLESATKDFLSNNREYTVYAHIKKSNIASYKSFLKAGFVLITEAVDNDIYKLMKKKEKHDREFVGALGKENVIYEVYKLNNHNADDTNAYLELFYVCFGRRPHLDKAWFDWAYKSNPDGECSNYILMDKKNKKFIGAYAYSPAVLQAEEKTYKVGIGVNGMVHPDYRNKGLYEDLIKIAADHDKSNVMEFAFPHGLNKGSIAGHKNAGWNIFKKIFFYANHQITNSEIDPRISEITSFNTLKNFSDIISRKENEGSFKKSAAWMNWRIFARPNKKYTVLGFFESSESIKGYIVLSYYKNERFKRCQIMDYKSESLEALASLVQGAKQTAFLNECDVLDLWLDDNSKDLDFFSDHSFKKTDEFYEMLCYNKEGINLNLNIKTVLADLDAV